MSRTGPDEEHDVTHTRAHTHTSLTVMWLSAALQRNSRRCQDFSQIVSISPASLHVSSSSVLFWVVFPDVIEFKGLKINEQINMTVLASPRLGQTNSSLVNVTACLYISFWPRATHIWYYYLLVSLPWTKWLLSQALVWDVSVSLPQTWNLHWNWNLP